MPDQLLTMMPGSSAPGATLPHPSTLPILPATPMRTVFSMIPGSGAPPGAAPAHPSTPTSERKTALPVGHQLSEKTCPVSTEMQTRALSVSETRLLGLHRASPETPTRTLSVSETRTLGFFRSLSSERTPRSPKASVPWREGLAAIATRNASSPPPRHASASPRRRVLLRTPTAESVQSVSPPKARRASTVSRSDMPRTVSCETPSHPSMEEGGPGGPGVQQRRVASVGA